MIAVYQHFHGLNREKQDRILDAAYRAFGRYGYKKTSMEQVAGDAGIAKGMVFHYFGSKLGLYEYLFAYACDYIQEYFDDLGDSLEAQDYISQYQLLVKIKLTAYTRRPPISEFLTMAFTHPENLEVSESVRRNWAKIMTLRGGVYSAVKISGATSRFRRDLDPEKTKRYITWLIDGYSQYILTVFANRPLADVDPIPYWDEFDGIVDDMKRLFYQEEDHADAHH